MTSQAAGTILSALVAEARARPRWGERPALYFVFLSRGKARLERAPVPDQAWGQQPTDDLLAIASLAAARAAVTPKPGLHAIAFRGEAWCAEAQAGTPQADQVIRDTTAGTIPHRPDSRQVRSVTAVDRDGSTYEITIFRDNGETRREVRSGPAQAHAATGTVPLALDLLIRAYLGITLPERRDFPLPEP
jgi:hypothetical protein